jgi:hypothetical protein
MIRLGTTVNEYRGFEEGCSHDHPDGCRAVTGAGSRVLGRADSNNNCQTG